MKRVLKKRASNEQRSSIIRKRDDDHYSNLQGAKKQKIVSDICAENNKENSLANLNRTQNDANVGHHKYYMNKELDDFVGSPVRVYTNSANEAAIIGNQFKDVTRFVKNSELLKSVLDSGEIIFALAKNDVNKGAFCRVCKNYSKIILQNPFKHMFHIWKDGDSYEVSSFLATLVFELANFLNHDNEIAILVANHFISDINLFGLVYEYSEHRSSYLANTHIREIVQKFLGTNHSVPLNNVYQEDFSRVWDQENQIREGCKESHTGIYRKRFHTKPSNELDLKKILDHKKFDIDDILLFMAGFEKNCKVLFEKKEVYLPDISVYKKFIWDMNDCILELMYLKAARESESSSDQEVTGDIPTQLLGGFSLDENINNVEI